jgi:hypothetical protein
MAYKLLIRHVIRGCGVGPRGDLEGATHVGEIRWVRLVGVAVEIVRVGWGERNRIWDVVKRPFHLAAGG